MVIVDDPRLKWLTNKQRYLAMIAKKTGKVRLRDFKALYSSKSNWSRAIVKLLDFGVILSKKGSTTFEYVPLDIEKQQTKVVDFDKIEKKELDKMEKKELKQIKQIKEEVKNA